MNIATILMVFVVAWWMVFFAALPFGVKAQHETDGDMVEGSDPGAPSNPKLAKKAGITTLIAIVLTLLYYGVATSGWIQIRAS